ncbi:hypothetical protein O4160_01620 [Rhodococcus sp. IEGM 1401]|uniref:Integral membrane protein n=1 Tax=Rhodococcus cercidiphylli TaxID=489916 RepID=A0ABU4ASJ4_9NOCA|nr:MULTISPECIES: hypothetical protein [Rhodococcus]KAA0928598.1 hypothetical protein FQ188_05430 [Rhodococcus sp. ANT_H53B]MCZ4559533.1 hypothetical protein [Rhodococcus sp. IEGM 1401]MDI6629831.1 hypothetical protein [Rhodococcus sp. (in: high G+C Gram-positive bacteria)]MDI9919514.1 hypothetical protein [Rhodococcus sp. IEGM 1372]MDI9924971.1 hypothetical protein [Rhodococcus sp. IEGM 1341]
MQHGVIDHGRLPLLCFLLGLLVGFLLIRLSVRMIRADVKWWPGNITPGGQHIHHVVFGIVLMLLAGIGLIAVYVDGSESVGAVLAAVFGIGAALVLDEFALIFYLRDVYWSEQGRTSVDAVFAAVGFTGLLLLGLHPLELLSPAGFRADPDPWVRGTLAVLALANLALGVVVLLKGKIWTGLLGLFVLPILVLAAVRLSRPSAPWARWRYTTRPKKMERALRREKRWRRPIIRAKIYLQDAIAGKPSIVHAREATEQELARTVLPAPMPSGTAASREAPISSNA